MQENAGTFCLAGKQEVKPYWTSLLRSASLETHSWETGENQSTTVGKILQFLIGAKAGSEAVLNFTIP